MDKIKTKVTPGHMNKQISEPVSAVHKCMNGELKDENKSINTIKANTKKKWESNCQPILNEEITHDSNMKKRRNMPPNKILDENYSYIYYPTKIWSKTNKTYLRNTSSKLSSKLSRYDSN
jgi:hypothetical protein